MTLIPAYRAARAEYFRSPGDDPRSGAHGILRGFNTYPVYYREPLDEVSASWQEALARSADAIHNSGWLSGGVAIATNNMVGTGLVPHLRPAVSIFGTPGAAREWARQVEGRFIVWANDPWSCDLGGRFSLGQITNQAVRHWFTTGDVLATLPYLVRPGNSHGTKINLLPASRMVAGNGSVDGVFLDQYGAPVAYNLLRRDPRPTSMTGMPIFSTQYQRVEARDRRGRRTALHIYDGEPSQVRGISPLAPVLLLIRECARLFGATLTQALIQAIFCGTIESAAKDTREVGEMLQSSEESNPEGVLTGDMFSAALAGKSEWYDSVTFDISAEFGKFAHLYPGDKLDFKRSETPNSTFKDFMRVILLEIARGLNITYVELTGDYAGDSYATTRMASANNWSTVLYRRSTIPIPLVQAVLECWLEEDVALGNTPFPGGIEAFLAQRAEACQADWRGPPMPQGDEEKAAKANEVKLRNRVITRQWWCAAEGIDWEDADEQEALEVEHRKKLGLDPIQPPANQQGKVNPNESGGDNPPEGAR